MHKDGDEHGGDFQEGFVGIGTEWSEGIEPGLWGAVLVELAFFFFGGDADLVFGGGIAYHGEVPRLEIGTARGFAGGEEAGEQDFFGDGFGGEMSHGSAGGEERKPLLGDLDLFGFGEANSWGEGFEGHGRSLLESGVGRLTAPYGRWESVGQHESTCVHHDGVEKMQSQAESVEGYLRELPADRQEALRAIRKVILANLDGGFEEGMQYGMIGYFVPHSLYPSGYHCDPKKPLPFAGLASQKGYISLYFMHLYADAKELKWFTSEYAKTGKKLDMGKSCIRFRQLSDVPLALIGKVLERITAKDYVGVYEKLIMRPAARSVGKGTAAVTAGKAVVRKVSAGASKSKKAVAGAVGATRKKVGASRLSESKREAKKGSAKKVAVKKVANKPGTGKKMPAKGKSSEGKSKTQPMGRKKVGKRG